MDRDYLLDLTMKIADTKSHLRARDEKIVSLMRYGQATADEIAEVTGLARSRIYQILESGK